MILLLWCIVSCNSVFAAGDELNLRCIENEREALLEFKRGLVNDDGFLSSWGSKEDQKECCQWKGIECSHDSGHVISLQLSTCEDLFMQLRGKKISNALLELKYLSHLDLSCIDFENVEIPNFIGSMKKLQYLNFHRSFFSGVVRHQLSNLTDLRTLDLGDNKLVFDNLHWLSRLSSLSLLDLSYNYLNDSNSLQDILNLPSLKELYLSSCVLFLTNFFVDSPSTSLSVLDLSSTGLTSSSFYWLFNISTSLRSLYMSENLLRANIPSEFGRLTFLEHLDLSYNQLTGGIPKSLGNLSHLQTLNLSDNTLSESLPEFFNKLYVGATQSLEILKLEKNNLSGSVPDFTLFPSLRILHLQNNQLNGHFPHGFAHISKLEVLDLSSNQIKGSVPDLSGFVSLRELHLGHNKLKLLPTSLGQLSMLEILDVSFNSVEGTISEIHLSKLHNLKMLDLSFNSLVFNVSDNWNPPFQLNVIELATCNIAPRFPTWLRTQTNLSRLDLSDNDISEEVPKWFWDVSPEIGYLNLSHNKIMGSIPDLSPLNYLILDLSYNNFSGPLPLRHPSYITLSLSNNMLVGSISSICTTSYLHFLDLSNNHFSGELPHCWENNTYLGILNLSNNKFSGNIPHSLSSLSRLSMLHLRNNDFSGELPSTLMNCSSLEMLDVGGNNLRGKIPTWIGTHLPYLTILNLGHNYFSGHIPTEICSLTGIQILDLSKNTLSGKLPQCVNNFTSLIQKNTTFDSLIYRAMGDFDIEMYIDHVLVQWKRQQAEYRKTTVGLVKLIDLSNNRLVGNIPNEFSQLRALISLNLSGNYLSGHIIPNIGQMEMLEILDLSRNNFSGEIPKGLAKLHHLAVLDMSNNHLSGKIPSSTQLQSFEPSAYAVNDGLCGPPLTRCPGDEPNSSTTQHGMQENINDDFMAQLHSHEFYIPIILGLIVGFWGAVGTLVLNSSWRNAYFNFFSRIGDWLYVKTMIYAGRINRRLRNNVPN